MNNLTRIKNFFTQNDKYLTHNKIEIIEINHGRVKLKMHIEDFHFNGMDVVHGGAIYTLCDLALSIAANSYGKACVSNSVSINYIKPGTGKYLIAEGNEISRGNKITIYNCNVYNEDKQLIAQATGNLFILNTKLLEI